MLDTVEPSQRWTMWDLVDQTGEYYLSKQIFSTKKQFSSKPPSTPKLQLNSISYKDPDMFHSFLDLSMFSKQPRSVLS